MFNRVVDWAVQNRLLVLIALAVLIATAAFQIPKLNLDAFPDVTNVQVAVNTEAPGLAAEEVEQLITVWARPSSAGGVKASGHWHWVICAAKVA